MANIWDHASIMDLLQRRQTLPPFIPPSQNPQLAMLMHPVAQAMAQAGQPAPAPAPAQPASPAPVAPPVDATLGQLASGFIDGSAPGAPGAIGGNAAGTGGTTGGGASPAAPGASSGATPSAPGAGPNNMSDDTGLAGTVVDPAGAATMAGINSGIAGFVDSTGATTGIGMGNMGFSGFGGISATPNDVSNAVEAGVTGTIGATMGPADIGGWSGITDAAMAQAIADAFSGYSESDSSGEGDGGDGSGDGDSGD